MSDFIPNIKCSSHTTDGSSRQDRILAVSIHVPETDTTVVLTAVYDGHGINGERIATTARDMTHAHFQQVTSSWIDRTDAEWTVDLTQLFETIHRSFEGSLGGSTAAIAFCFVRAEGTKSRLIHANVGDTLIYVIDKVTRTGRTISVDHSPENLDEANRLHQLGPQALTPIYMTQRPHTTPIFIADPNNAGMVMKNTRYEDRSVLWGMRCAPATVDYDPQVYLHSPAGSIAVSRALADYKHVPYGMICTPHVGSTVLDTNEFVIIASDGITDVNQRASLPGYIIDTVASSESLEVALARITTDANQTWHTRFGSADDASIAMLA
jgi:serine/threonine protein phosphatase PrpC